ncbi:hypothetical protein [Streptomyces griseorubiginosus]|uniref:Uncharacterized protein n=1 Tax=Streptomyces griseorubiginosus TaxID=67304 RepID=A0A101RML9_9ACTN|nr:hypothetical protein [Streptomyces griseorubiginosus]KUN58324.1 hypothetical protein AQJ54_42410 [Streptomyces griseorubiginosus]
MRLVTPGGFTVTPMASYAKDPRCITMAEVLVPLLSRSRVVGVWHLPLSAGSVADLGGVGGPVVGGGSLPFDGDGDGEAEGAGEDGCGQLGGELEQGGRAGFGEPDAEVAEPFAHGPGTDRAAGLAARNEPGRVCTAEDGMAASDFDLLQGQLGDGL